jgi:hypothetical protein
MQNISKKGHNGSLINLQNDKDVLERPNVINSYVKRPQQVLNVVFDSSPFAIQIILYDDKMSSLVQELFFMRFSNVYDINGRG